MRVLILTPTALPTVTGNAVTAERWRRGLSALGVEVGVLAARGLAPAALVDTLRRFEPDVVHAHHAFGSGVLALRTPSPAPLVVSPAGTDLHVDLLHPGRGHLVREVLSRAKAVVCQGEDTARRVEAMVPEAGGRVARVQKAFVWLGDDPFDARAAAGCGPEGVLFFLPAGVRTVKGNLECLVALEEVWRRRPTMRALFAGPALEPDYAERFRREVSRLHRFATWLPALPPTSMQAAYQGADVVLNASRAEGLSNALLEAAAAGRAVLATDVPGNRAAVTWEPPGPPSGLLYALGSPEDFVARALTLVDDGPLRAALGRAAAARAAARPTPQEEATALAAVYARALEREERSR